MRIKPRSLVNFGLLVLVAIAAGVLAWKRDPAPQAGFALLPAALEKVQRIELERSSGMRVVLARVDGHWRMQVPAAARLDDVALARVLELGRVQWTQRLPATDLGRFDLDEPWARIRFDTHSIEFGMSNALTQELYARSGDSVYVLPARYAAHIPGEASKLIAHRLFAADEQPVAFRLERFSVRAEEGHWRLAPEDGGLSQDDLLRWVDQWRLASSIITQPQTGAPARASIPVELRDGRAIKLQIIALTPDFVVRRDDEQLEYHFPSRLAQLLLAPPAAAGESKR